MFANSILCLVRFVVAFSLIAFATPSFASAEGRVEITFDYSNAEVTLRLFENSNDAVAVDSWMALAATKAVLDKVKTRQPEANAGSMKATLIGSASPQWAGTEDFAWRYSRRRKAETAMLLANIKARENEFKAALQSRFGAYLLANQSVDTTVHFVIGSRSSAWAVGENDFYISLPFYSGDSDGVLMMMMHELFHNVQKIARPINGTLPTRSLNSGVHEIASSLFVEGTASFVGDRAFLPDDAPYKADGAYIAQMRQRYLMHQDQMPDLFALLDLILVRVGTDPSAKWQTYEVMALDWDWGNSFYEAGAEMMLALDKNNPGSLFQYMRGPPITFVADYVRLCRTQVAGGHCKYRLSTQAETVILAAERSVSSARRRTQ